MSMYIYICICIHTPCSDTRQAYTFGHEAPNPRPTAVNPVESASLNVLGMYVCM